MMGNLSPHFDEKEFRCHGFGHAGHPDHATVVSDVLVRHLEQLRKRVGGPIVIVSGHRCEWWNARIGGARSSQHLNGRAADLHRGVATAAQADQAGFGGIGTKGPWAVHVDVRSTKSRWAE